MRPSLASIQAGEIPGAVVLVARHGRIAYFKAFGNRSVKPGQEAMTTDTIFDMASMTKVMATAPSIMLLAEEGILRLDDKVKRYLPEFHRRREGRDHAAPSLDSLFRLAAGLSICQNSGPATRKRSKSSGK